MDSVRISSKSKVGTDHYIYRGILFADVLKTPEQISITGSAVMLLFGILGGSFFDLNMLPDWISVVNKITPNA